MSYHELRASAALAGLVECGWVDTATADAVQEVLPDGCMDLIWTGGELLVAGPDTAAHRSTRTRGVTVAGLRFLPGALPSLLDVPAAPLQNRRVALVDLAPGPARAALARLEHGAEPVSVLVALAVRLPGEPPDRSVAALRRAFAPMDPVPSGLAYPGAEIDVSGVSAPENPARVDLDAPTAKGSVAALADALGCTPRSVHRRCQAAFGYGPAVLLRAGVSPVEVAIAAGYADQPHLSRETRALAGASPGQLASGANMSTPLPSGSSTTA